MDKAQQPKCPECGKPQDSNGLIAWCVNAHVYTIAKDDPRYTEQ